MVAVAITALRTAKQLVAATDVVAIIALMSVANQLVNVLPMLKFRGGVQVYLTLKR